MIKKFGNLELKVVENEWNVYFDMALVMLEEIMSNNKANRPTVMIVPVGPTEQYPILARLINQLGVSLKNVHFFNMDEYLLTPDTCISAEDKMSFKHRMNSEFYSLVNPELIMPKNQRHFPEPGKEAEYDALIDSLGGVDLCLVVLGLTGTSPLMKQWTKTILLLRKNLRTLVQEYYPSPEKHRRSMPMAISVETCAECHGGVSRSE